MKKDSNRQLIYIGLVIVIALLAAAGFVLQQLIKRADSDAVYSGLHEVAKSEAHEIELQINNITTRLQDTSKKPEIVDALARSADNRALLTELCEKIKLGDKYANKVELIPTGQSENFLLSFAELDQVKRAEQGAVQLPEAILLKDGAWKFSISVPVQQPDTHQTVGVLFASYNMDQIAPFIKNIDHALGDLTLVQRFENAEPSIVVTSEKTAPKIGQENLEQVGKSTWYIFFKPNAAIYINEGISSLVLRITLGVLVILAIALSFFVIRSARRSGVGVIVGGEKPIQIASAKTVTKGGKADAALVSELTRQSETAAMADDFNEISDPLFQHGEILEIAEVSDEELEHFAESTPPAAGLANTVVAPAVSSGAISPVIFRDYDIRGNADLYLDDEAARIIGQAIGSEAQSRGEMHFAVASDGRISSPRLKESLIRGLLESGVHVVDIGSVPSPVLYFVTETTDVRSGVMVTASHNPASDNGFKIIIGGKTLSDDAIQALYERIKTRNLMNGSGNLTAEDYTEAYVEKVTSDIALSSQLKIVIDCGNGITGGLAPRILNDLGCEVVPLFCDIDGSFPNHDPDPSVPANLKALIDRVLAEKADLGIALDGDGDRLVAVTSTGKVALPDRLLMIYAKDVVARNPGTDIVFDVKCSRKLTNLISGYGGRPVMWKSGHAHIRNKMQETGAMLGGELSGHIFFKERWFGFDDGIYATARLLEILTMRDQTLDAILASMPTTPITPEIRIPVDEDKKFEWVDRLIQKGEFSGGKIITIDGLRVDFAKGWGLVRASNTAACLTLRFEADNDEMLEKIKGMFRQQLKAVIPELDAKF